MDKKNKKPVLAIVTWGDAHAGATWTRKEITGEYASDLEVVWVGFIISESDKGIQMTMGFDENDNCAGTMWVPKGMIKKIRKVKY